jgi:hypothetical protein
LRGNSSLFPHSSSDTTAHWCCTRTSETLLNCVKKPIITFRASPTLLMVIWALSRINFNNIINHNNTHQVRTNFQLKLSQHQAFFSDNYIEFCTFLLITFTQSMNNRNNFIKIIKTIEVEKRARKLICSTATIYARLEWISCTFTTFTSMICLMILIWYHLNGSVWTCLLILEWFALITDTRFMTGMKFDS